jgi:flagellar biosynthetic protein FliR
MQSVLDNPQTWALTGAKATLWILVMTRITGLLAGLPGLGNERLPMQVRAAFAVLMAVVMTPALPAMKAPPTGIFDLSAALAVEFAVGLLMGTLVAFVLSAVAFGANLVDIQTGFSFVQFLNPANPQPASVAGTLLGQVAMVLVFAMGLHHQMILALADSYRLVPLGGSLNFRVFDLVTLTGGLLAKGLQMAFPVLLALFLIDVLEAFSARFMPQLQLLQLSFPLKIAVGMVMLGFILMELPGWIAPLFSALPAWALRLLG